MLVAQPEPRILRPQRPPLVRAAPGFFFTRGARAIQRPPRTSGGGAVFDPATLALTGWWRGDYTASPWTGTASAGSSGSRDLTEATNPPGTATLNGYSIASFDGTNDILNGPDLGDLHDTDGYGGWYLCNVSAASWDEASFNNPSFIGQASVNFSLFLDGNGGSPFVGVIHWNGGAYDGGSVTVNFTLSQWNLVQYRYTGSALELRVNGGTRSTQAASNATVSGATRMGLDRNNAFWIPMQVADIGTMDFSPTDTEEDNVLSYCRSRYALALT